MRLRIATAALAAAALVVPAAAASASGRYDLCVLKRTDAQHVQCAHTFTSKDVDGGFVAAGFRDHSARSELYGVCITRPLRYGGCTNVKYQRRLGSDGTLAWSAVGVTNIGSVPLAPGSYTVAWYSQPRRGRGRLLGRWRFRVTPPPGTLGNSLPIADEIDHLFSQPPTGYDANGDGVIDRRNESKRADDAMNLWDGTRLFIAVGGDAETIPRSRFETWFRSFDKNRDGKLTLTQTNGQPNGEFAAACRAVWGDPSACRYVTLTAFEESLGN
jgi:hypothetical protein